MSIAICFKNVSKKYRLGEVGTGTLSHDLHRTWAKLRGKPDPFLKVGEVNDRTKTADNSYTWALNDISFDLEQGEILGIIGRNGAGKSTLLKLLSRVTAPTSGSIKAKGRIASLLEVGTGFHPELTGRENVYLNGSILGMRRHEISKLFDEIVEFSGCQRYIDTPVKRYSSGMIVRLGFAVAAHLQCENLVIDEVLAVGDAEFQKKCLGKMQSVASEGRTVLFVSHNLQAVSTLTTKAIVLNEGRLDFAGSTQDALSNYSDQIFGPEHIGKPYQAKAEKPHPYLAFAQVQTSGTGVHICGDDITFHFDISSETPCDGLRFSFNVCDEAGTKICHFWLLGEQSCPIWGAGLHRLSCHLPGFRLYMGRYTLTTWLSDLSSDTILEQLSEICAFEVSMGDVQREEYPWHPGEMAFMVDSQWTVSRKELGTR